MTETPDWKSMAGTEGTGEYNVVARNDAGDRIGIRSLGMGNVRIRIEPGSDERTQVLAESLTRDAGWKQPGDESQNRFSTVSSGKEGESTVLGAIEALKGYDGTIERNRAKVAWAWRALLDVA